MLKTRRPLLAILVFSLGACAKLGPGRGMRAQGALYYLEPAQVQMAGFPAAPPAESEVDKADLAALRQLQLKRSQADCDRARSEADASYEEFFSALSPLVKPLPPRAGEIFLRMKADTDAAVDAVKRRYKRERPFRRDSGLEPCLGRVGGYAYPSGHAALSRLYGRVLSDLDPGRKAEFMARADEAAWDRVLGGVHHPSDVEAGKRLGDALYDDMRRSPSFRADMETLRRSLAPRQGP